MKRFLLISLLLVSISFLGCPYKPTSLSHAYDVIYEVSGTGSIDIMYTWIDDLKNFTVTTDSDVQLPIDSSFLLIKNWTVPKDFTVLPVHMKIIATNVCFAQIKTNDVVYAYDSVTDGTLILP